MMMEIWELQAWKIWDVRGVAWGLRLGRQKGGSIATVLPPVTIVDIQGILTGECLPSPAKSIVSHLLGCCGAPGTTSRMFLQLSNPPQQAVTL